MDLNHTYPIAESNRYYTSRTGSVTDSPSLLFCTLIVSQLGRFVKGVFLFFFEISSRAQVFAVCSCPPSRRTLGSVVSPLDIISIPQTAPKVNWNVAQLWEVWRMEVCAICLLTKLTGCGIMEISPASIESGRLKKLLSAKAYSNSLTQQTL